MMCFDELEEVNGIDACLELQNDQAENIKNTYENSAKYYVINQNFISTWISPWYHGKVSSEKTENWVFTKVFFF